MPVLDFSGADYSLSIGGEDMKLTDLIIQLQSNAPPAVHGVAVPSSVVEQKVVQAADVEEFWNTYKKTDSNIGSECVNLNISSVGDEDMNFNAQNWILMKADASISATAGAAGATAIEFTAGHPILTLNTCPANVGPASPAPLYTDIQGSTYLDILKSAMEKYLEKVPDTTKQQPAYKLMQEGSGKLSEFLDCEGVTVDKLKSLFDGLRGGGDVEDGFKKYILDCVEHGGENSTIYDFVVQGLASEFSLRLHLDDSDLSARKLKLKPSIPYTTKKVSIKTSDIISIGSSGGDWAKPTGLSTCLSLPTGLIWNASHQDNSDPLIPSKYVSVIAKEARCQIFNVNPPEWFMAIVNHTTTPNYNAPHEVSDPVPYSENVEGMEKAMKKLLTQYFLDLYRQTTSITVRKIYSLKDSGGSLIVPGITCCIEDESGPQLLFNVSQVQHSFNLNQNVAETSITGNYVRAADFSVEVEGAEESNLISNGFSADKNYIWS